MLSILRRLPPKIHHDDTTRQRSQRRSVMTSQESNTSDESSETESDSSAERYVIPQRRRGSRGGVISARLDPEAATFTPGISGHAIPSSEVTEGVSPDISCTRSLPAGVSTNYVTSSRDSYDTHITERHVLSSVGTEPDINNPVHDSLPGYLEVLADPEVRGTVGLLQDDMTPRVRRSSRERRPPAWMSTGYWKLDS